MEALEAIFMEEFCLISTSPPKFSIKLRAPGTDDSEPPDREVHGPPSQLFTLKFTLPRGYPAQGGDPVVEVVGPLGGNDPLRHALLEYFAEQVGEHREQMGGAGYIYPLVESIREWIDSNVPEDVGQRRGAAAAAAGGLGVSGGGGAQFPAVAGVAAAVAAADGGGGGNGGGAGDTSDLPWWEKEEADHELIQRAIKEAAAASWGAWAEEAAATAVEAEESLGGNHSTSTSSSSSTGGAVGSSSSSSRSTASATAAAAGGGGGGGGDVLQDGDGSRGRWDYVIGLVGKPSAGKSTFFNAVTGM
jgi:hypothetical protein